MAVGRMRHNWDQSALIWSTLANLGRDAKKQSKPFMPFLVHPFRTEKDYEAPKIKADISVLKALIPRGNGKRNTSGAGLH